MDTVQQELGNPVEALLELPQCRVSLGQASAHNVPRELRIAVDSVVVEHIVDRTQVGTLVGIHIHFLFQLKLVLQRQKARLYET